MYLKYHFLASCVRFVGRTDEEDYVDIIPGSGGCYAIIPYWSGRGRLEVGLEQTGCVTMKIVVHELLHALGIKHEQSRPDRDSFITMVWTNLRVKQTFTSFYYLFLSIS